MLVAAKIHCANIIAGGGSIPLPVSNPCLFPDVSIGQNQVCTDIYILK